MTVRVSQSDPQAGILWVFHENRPALLALVTLGRRFLRRSGVALWTRLPPTTAAVLGALMLVQRL